MVRRWRKWKRRRSTALIRLLLPAKTWLIEYAAAAGTPPSLHMVSMSITCCSNTRTNVPEALKSLERPLALFWGLIDQRLDVKWLQTLANSMSSGSIALVGPQQTAGPGTSLDQSSTLYRPASLRAIAVRGGRRRRIDHALRGPSRYTGYAASETQGVFSNRETGRRASPSIGCSMGERAMPSVVPRHLRRLLPPNSGRSLLRCLLLDSLVCRTNTGEAKRMSCVRF